MQLQVDKKSKTVTIEADFDFDDFNVAKFPSKYRNGYRFHYSFRISKWNHKTGMLFPKLFRSWQHYPESMRVESIDKQNRCVTIKYQ